MRNFPQFVSDMTELINWNRKAKIEVTDKLIDDMYLFLTTTESNWTETADQLFERHLSDESNVDRQLVVFTMYFNVGDIVKAMDPAEWQYYRNRFETGRLIEDLKDTGRYFDYEDIVQGAKRFLNWTGEKLDKK